MARIKFASDVDPIRGKSDGYTFQWNTAAHNMYAKSRNARTRYPNQSNSQQFLWRALSSWRNMPAGVKQAWNDYAAAYPEPSKHNPAVMLSGYQLFLKRNSYVSLNCGLDYDFMTAPSMEVLPAPSVSFELKAGNNSIDVTEMYLKYFGLLPSPGQSVLFRCIPMSQSSGQFFDVINDVLTVEEVYIDGFFINLIFPANPQNLLFSIFLSKPVSPGQSYAGTKIRYMGCFGSKTFVGLSDVPAVGVPEAGKVWGVKPDGTWGVIEGGGGGGLACEDLPTCPTIIDIYSIIDTILNFIVEFSNSSVPPVNYGLLYNRYAFVDPRGMFQSDFYLPTQADILSLVDYLGGYLTAAIYLKETGTVWWNSPNTGATNSKELYLRGTASRNSVGSFVDNRNKFFGWTSTPYPFAPFNANYRWDAAYNTTRINYASVTNKWWEGLSIRLFKASPGSPDGQKGFYTGNNGRSYRTVVINEVEIMMDNLAETKYNNGDNIDYLGTDPTGYFTAAEWIALNSGALCAYGNDFNNV